MKFKKDLHTHSIYSDGENTMEEMVLKAIELGMEEYGISDHSYTFFDESYCMPLEKYDEYKEEAARLKEKYKDKILFKCGVEQDYYSEAETEGFDYVIGSVHYMKIDDKYFEIDGVDESIIDDISEIVEKNFEGDVFKFLEEYFKAAADVVNKTGCDIIGHFDIITKFNEKRPFFDEKDERYVKIWKDCVDKLIPFGKPFEINAAALRKGLRSEPYPSFAIQSYIREKGGKFVFSSDSHDICALSAEYDENRLIIK